MQALSITDDDTTPCSFCHSTSQGKGVDSHGHIHCRLCPDYNASAFMFGGRHHSSQADRHTPATGDTWTVWCNGKQETARAVKNRNPPAPFQVPAGMFRSTCRMITIVVGKDDAAQSFSIEEPLLRSASGYFNACLNNPNFKEARAGRVVLDDKDPAIFGLLNEYLHLGAIQQKEQRHIPVPVPAPGFEDDDDPSKYLEVESPTMNEYCRLWMLADYLHSLSLKNYAMWRLVTMSDNSQYKMEPEDMEELYACAPADSLLRDFLIHLYVWRHPELTISMDAPRKMLNELILELKRARIKEVRNPLMDVGNYYDAGPPGEMRELPREGGDPDAEYESDYVSPS